VRSGHPRCQADLALQVVFHARIAAEREDGTGFTVDDVADGIVAKLVRRYPYVFGDVTVSGADEVKRNWDEIKRAKRNGRGLNGKGGTAPDRLLRRYWIACRSGSLRLRWRRGCSAGRRGRACPTNWPAWAGARISAPSYSGLSRRHVRWGLIRRWSCGRSRADTVSSFGCGRVRSILGHSSVALDFCRLLWPKLSLCVEERVQ
jgi:hypothetical protein